MNEMIQKQQLVLPQTVSDLNNSLALIKPDNSETTQLITYALLATALVGIFVYQYLKQQEKLD